MNKEEVVQLNKLKRKTGLFFIIVMGVMLICFNFLIQFEVNKEKRDEAIKALKSKPKVKKEKAKIINKNITKIYLNGGKKKKLRAGDFVGAISRIEGITAEDIGIIDVQDTVSYIDILNGKGNKVIEGLKNSTIKGKKLRVERARK